MTDELTAMKARIYNLERNVTKEKQERLLIASFSSPKIVDGMQKSIKEAGLKLDAAVARFATITELSFFSRKSGKTAINTLTWFLKNLDAPDKNWMDSYESLSIAEWMKMIEDGTPLVKPEGHKMIGRPSKHE